MIKSIKILTALLIAAGALGIGMGVSTAIDESKSNAAVRVNATSTNAQWYLTGTINGKDWGEFQPFTTSDGVNYSFTFTATNQTEFKIYDSDSYSSYEINRSSGFDYDNKGWVAYTESSGKSNNIRIKYNGDYVITYCATYTVPDSNPAWFFYIAPVTKTIYYVSNSEYDTTDRIYAWRSGDADLKEFGNWPGTSITTAGTDVTGVVDFNGTSYKRIYRIPTHSTHFKFANNDGSVQSASDLTVVDGAAYWWDGPANSDAGAAISLIIDAEAARNAATYKGHPYSICGIDSGVAQGLVNRYNSLTSAARAYVNNSSTKTYTDASASSEGYISFQRIFERLAIIGGSSLTSSRVVQQLAGGDVVDMTMVVILTGTIAVSSLSLFVIKKRKQK